MKQKQNNQTSFQNVRDCSDDQSMHQVYDFFALLMKIDKRNNRKIMKIKKVEIVPIKPRRTDWVCQHCDWRLPIFELHWRSHAS